jgi:hypothetical protein
MRCKRRRFLKFKILDDQKTTDASSGAQNSEEELVAGVTGAEATGEVPRA